MSTEEYLRRVARRQGKRLVKSHARDRRAVEYGRYFLLADTEELPPYTGHPRPGSLSLREAEEKLLYPLAWEPDTRTFPVGLLEEWDVAFAHSDLVVEHQQLDRSRWYENIRSVFRAPDDGLVWGVVFQSGLTELQEGLPPFEMSAEHGFVTGTRMEQRQVAETKWVPVA